LLADTRGWAYFFLGGFRVGFRVGFGDGDLSGIGIFGGIAI
jgi:hypothetical protein